MFIANLVAEVLCGSVRVGGRPVWLKMVAQQLLRDRGFRGLKSVPAPSALNSANL